MRKRFLIKPALQLKHLAWTLSVVLLAFTACYLLFERQVTAALANGALDQATWLMVRMDLRIGFGVALVTILIGVGLENYFFFHSVVGPIYALEKGIKRLTAGDFENEIVTRKHDELAEVVQAFETMKKHIAARLENYEKAAQLLTHELESLLKNASPENIEILRKRLSQIRSNVESKAA
jgi:methyl-accepting chemotaxis protein